jgi:hypothetical protein
VTRGAGEPPAEAVRLLVTAGDHVFVVVIRGDWRQAVEACQAAGLAVEVLSPEMRAAS